MSGPLTTESAVIHHARTDLPAGSFTRWAAHASPGHPARGFLHFGAKVTHPRHIPPAGHRSAADPEYRDALFVWFGIAAVIVLAFTAAWLQG